VATGQRAQHGLEILVNGAARVVPAGCTVAALLAELDVRGRRVAVARNREVVPRSRFALEALAAGDRVEILEAVGGG
jgi:thiamine biosynthesis protein ThiS